MRVFCNSIFSQAKMFGINTSKKQNGTGYNAKAYGLAANGVELALSAEAGGNTAHEGGLAAARVSSQADDDGLLARGKGHGDDL